MSNNQNNNQKTNNGAAASNSGPSMDDFSYPQAPGANSGATSKAGNNTGSDSKVSQSDSQNENVSNTQKTQEPLKAGPSPTSNSSNQQSTSSPKSSKDQQSTNEMQSASSNNSTQNNGGDSSSNNQAQKTQSGTQPSKGSSGGGKPGSSIADLAKKLSGWKDDFLKGEEQTDSGQQQVDKQQGKSGGSNNSGSSAGGDNSGTSQTGAKLPTTKPGSNKTSGNDSNDTMKQSESGGNENDTSDKKGKDPAELLKQLSKAEQQNSQAQTGSAGSGENDDNKSGNGTDTAETSESDTTGSSESASLENNSQQPGDKKLSGALKQKSPLSSDSDKSQTNDNSALNQASQNSQQTQQTVETQAQVDPQQKQTSDLNKSSIEPKKQDQSSGLQQNQGTKQPQTDLGNSNLDAGTLQPNQNQQQSTEVKNQQDGTSSQPNGHSSETGTQSPQNSKAENNATVNSTAAQNTQLGSSELESGESKDSQSDKPKATVSSGPQSKSSQVGKYPHTIAELLELVIDKDASDLHVTVGYPAMMRIDGKLEKIGTDLITQETAMDLILPVLPENKRELLEVNREVDLAYAFRDDARFRVNAYYERGRPAMAMRLIPNKIRSIEELKLPGVYHQFAKINQGFVLVTGPTGHGKSTTLAAILQEINENYQKHIITIEDPIEYIYPQGRALVDQREMHEDTHSWEIALRSALRQDPDVVLVGEMRDYETIGSAITLAETGHLVFATLHTNNAAQTVDRIIDVFPEHQQEQVRSQLSNIIEAIISQRLVAIQGGGRRAVSEILICNPAVKNLIREGKTHQIDNVIRTSRDIGMRSLEQSLVELVREGLITVEQAEMNAVHPEEVVRLLK